MVLFFVTIMTNKEVVIKVLEKLLPYRDKAEWLLFLIKNVAISDDTIKKLASFLSNVIKNVKKSLEQKNYYKSLANVNKIQWVQEDFDENSLDMLLQKI